MGVKIQRKKPSLVWLSAFYRMQKLLPMSTKAKFKMFLNLAWMFDRFASESSFSYYTRTNHPMRLSTINFMGKYLKPHFNVLDLGCGRGDISGMIAGDVRRSVGIDHDKSAIANASATYKAPNLEFSYGDAREFLENNHEKFDVLILCHVLEHLDNPEEFIITFKDFFDYIYIELPDFDKTYLNYFRKDLGLKLVYSDDDHVSEFDRYELADMLSRCNLEIADSKYTYGVQQLWCRVKK